MHKRNRNVCIYVLTCLFAALTMACSDEGIDSDEEARRAYLGLDPSIGKSLALGFEGFNEASSANIAPQMDTGDLSGMLTITGQVDQGASDNKGMRLYVGMVDYADVTVIVENGDEEEEVQLTYATSTDATMQPFLSLSLRNIPDGTFTGTLTGIYLMSGDIDGEVRLDLTMEGTIQDDGTGNVIRTPGGTTVTGTATSGDGNYDVNITI